MERFFYRQSEKQAGKDIGNFGRVIFAEDRSDFHRKLVEVSVLSFQKSGNIRYGGESSNRMHEGRLFKIPSGVPPYEEQIDLANELSDNEVLTVHGHGDLSDTQVNTLVNLSGGGRDVTIKLTDEEWIKRKSDTAREMAEAISVEMVDSEIGGYGTVSQEKMVRSTYHFGHTQCGAAQQNFVNVLQRHILDSNEALRDNRSGSERILHLIDLREDIMIGVIPDRVEGSLKIRTFTQNELNVYLSEKGLRVGYETQCVDDNFPFLSAEESGLAEKSYRFNRDINPQLAQRERTRKDTYIHNVGIIFIGTQSDSEYASFLQNSTQVLRNLSPRVGNDEQLANSSASLIYLMKPEWVRKYISGVSGIYELVGPGHFSTKMKKVSAIKFDANPLYHGQYPQIRGVSVGLGRDLGQANLIKTASNRFEDIPRGPVLALSASVVENLGGWQETLTHLEVNKYFYSGIVCVDPEAEAVKSVLYYYDNTHEDKKPVTSFGWKSISG